MYSYCYSRQVTSIVKEFVFSMDIDWGDFSPIRYHIKEFLYNFFMFPVAITRIFKEDLVKLEVHSILEKNYGLTAEK